MKKWSEKKERESEWSNPEKKQEIKENKNNFINEFIREDVNKEREK